MDAAHRKCFGRQEPNHFGQEHVPSKTPLLEHRAERPDPRGAVAARRRARPMEESPPGRDPTPAEVFGLALFIQLRGNACDEAVLPQAVFLLSVVMTACVCNGSLPSNG